MQNLWEQLCKQTPTYPDVLQVAPEAAALMDAIIRRQRWLDRLCSPQGLKQLFPSLRG